MPDVQPITDDDVELMAVAFAKVERRLARAGYPGSMSGVLAAEMTVGTVIAKWWPSILARIHAQDERIAALEAKLLALRVGQLPTGNPRLAPWNPPRKAQQP